ncbi:hypothetical protein [Phaeobacter phage MD18]|nr:hypothetical protein [Phaeobacter phage MD18]
MTSKGHNDVYALLEKILEELRDIRKEVAEASATPPAPSIPAYSPVAPYNAPSELPLPKCAKCGISLSSVMGYACSDQHCPTGLGPATC